MVLPFFTVGHSTRTIPEFVRLLQAGGVETVADIRAIPRSRTNPQFNRETLPEALAGSGIGYEYIPDLGGRRGRARDIPDPVNAFWTNRSFHNYADYAMGAEFGAGLNVLLALGRERRTAMMCSEAVWWRCHRRIVADYLLAAGETVFHLMDGDRIEPATLTPAARMPSPKVLEYPAEPSV